MVGTSRDIIQPGKLPPSAFAESFKEIRILSSKAVLARAGTQCFDKKSPEVLSFV